MQYATADNLSLSEYDRYFIFENKEKWRQFSDNVRSRAMTSESGIMTGLSSSFMDDSIGGGYLYVILNLKLGKIKE